MRSWGLFFVRSRTDVSSIWMRLAGTAIFSATIALGFTVLGFVINARTLDDWLSPRNWLHHYANSLVTSLVIGYLTHGLFILAWRFVGPARVAALAGWQHALFFMSLVLLAVAVGWPLGIALNGNVRALERLSAAEVLGIVAMSLLVSTLLYVFFMLRQRGLRAEARASEAQLRLLQGQMEPHFLFNTLATVASLIEIDPPRARRVLEAFTDYLRASLASLRRSESTLGAELELAENFLSLMRERMGERLRFRIDVDDALREATLPPLLLQPLVENAVRHGLETQIDGGTVRVHARLEAGATQLLRLCVEDDGAGLEAASQRRPLAPGHRAGAGIALANLRERLAAHYGDTASLTLAPQPAGSGVVACIVLPYSEARVATTAAAPPPEALRTQGSVS
jgi:signal transduction histidine kinase